MKEQDVSDSCVLPADTLCAVLERDTLSIRESRLFGAVVRWAEAECQRQQLPVTSGNKQRVLGKALSLIRFPLMTIEEFAAGEALAGPESVWTRVSPREGKKPPLLRTSHSPSDVIHVCAFACTVLFNSNSPSR